MKNLFVVPNNDAEAQAIQALLLKNNQEYKVTEQPWGASWEGLEDTIKEKLNDSVIYGVELKGQAPNNAINIDHHCYEGDDRSNPKSSIEQVAELLGIELTIEQQFIAANDKGYIPAMEQLAKEMQIDPTQIIAKVRLSDRNAQGVTPEHEIEAEKAISEADLSNRRMFVVRPTHSKTSTICDRLFGQYDNLLVLSGDGEVNFYGSKHVIEALTEKFPGGWAGGGIETGFWGGYPNQDEVLAVVKQQLSL